MSAMQSLLSRFEPIFKDQEQIIMLIGGDGTYCFVEKTSHGYENEKSSPFLRKFLRQSKSATPKRVQIEAKLIPCRA